MKQNYFAGEQITFANKRNTDAAGENKKRGAEMLVLNLKRIMNLRGIERVYSFLAEHDFIHSTAWKIENEKLSSIKISQIGKLCVLLNCTPNDLFEWREDPKNSINETHALRSMIKEEVLSKSLKELVKDIPVEKLPEIERLLKGLKDG